MNAIVAVLLANAVLVVPLALAAWVTMRLLRRPAISHALWVLALIKLLTPPVVSPQWVVDPQQWPALAAILPEATSPAQAGTGVAGDAALETSSLGALDQTNAYLAGSSAQSATGRAAPAGPQQPETSPGRLWVGLVTVWIIGSLLCIALFARRIRLVGRLIRSSGKQDSMASALAESLFGVSLRAPPRVILVDAVISPTLIGIGPWTRILYPRRLWRELPAEQRDGLLIHELEHFRRGDHWVRVLEAAATAVFWWHPIVWWARHHIEITEESCCDAVASRGCNELSYAEALLTTLDFINEPSWSPAAPVGTGVSRLPVLEQRLKQIVHHSIPGQLSLVGRTVLLLLAALTLPIQPWIFGGRIATASSFTLPPKPAALTPAVPFETDLHATVESNVELIELPPAPNGWWTPQPAQSWEHVAHDDPDGTRLVVNADGRILLRGGITDGVIDLSDYKITAAAFWDSSRRLVTGDAYGQVRLWDVASGEPVSLLGRHGSEVTSLTIGEDGTLITGGRNGTLIAWDLQSGAIRANWATFGRPIQSVRLFDEGRRAAVIAADWRSDSSRIVVLDSQFLEPLFDRVISESLATTRVDDNQLTFIDWSGKLLRLNSRGDLEQFGSTPKGVVSAFVFSQDARIEIAPDQNVIRS